MNDQDNSARPELDAAAIFRVLEEHQVAYLVIGGFGALLHNAPVPPTKDLDITPATDRANLMRVMEALKELQATLRVNFGKEGEQPVPINLHPDWFSRVQTMTLFTSAGPLDVALKPQGTEGYPDLARNAVSVEFQGRKIPVAALDDIVRSKAAAGRPKDIQAIRAIRSYQSKLTTDAGTAALTDPRSIDSASSEDDSPGQTPQKPGPT